MVILLKDPSKTESPVGPKSPIRDTSPWGGVQVPGAEYKGNCLEVSEVTKNLISTAYN